MDLDRVSLYRLEEISSPPNSLLNYAIVLHKPDFPEAEKEAFTSFCGEYSLQIIFQKTLKLEKHQIMSVYHDLFQGKGDRAEYGLKWKLEVLDYLTSGNSVCFLLQGHGAQNLACKYKHALREKYGKITTPQQRLSTADFRNKVVQNLIHTAAAEDFASTYWSLLI